MPGTGARCVALSNRRAVVPGTGARWLPARPALGIRAEGPLGEMSEEAGLDEVGIRVEVGEVEHHLADMVENPIWS